MVFLFITRLKFSRFRSITETTYIYIYISIYIYIYIYTFFFNNSRSPLFWGWLMKDRTTNHCPNILLLLIVRRLPTRKKKKWCMLWGSPLSSTSTPPYTAPSTPVMHAFSCSLDIKSTFIQNIQYSIQPTLPRSSSPSCSLHI